jgi:hypothetical protein
MRTLRGIYYKDRPKGVELMSGIPLPKDEDGKVRNIKFERCEFHPNCDPERYPEMYENCKFVDCY